MTDRDMVNEAREYRRRCDEERPKTLRDEIAIAAMQGIITTIPAMTRGLNHEEISNAAYLYADSMLRAREGK